MNREYIKEQYKPEMENLLLILTALQQSSQSNSISPDDMAWTAGYLNTSLSSVYGVVKYYSMFSTEPRGKFTIRICRSPVCNMMAERSLTSAVEGELATADGQVTDDGMFSVETVECLGHCESAPVMMVNEEVYGNLSTGKIQDIIMQLRKKTG